jgi:hypothetical protein
VLEIEHRALANERCRSLGVYPGVHPTPTRHVTGPHPLVTTLSSLVTALRPTVPRSRKLVTQAGWPMLASANSMMAVRPRAATASKLVAATTKLVTAHGPPMAAITKLVSAPGPPLTASTKLVALPGRSVTASTTLVTARSRAVAAITRLVAAPRRSWGRPRSS